MGVASSPICWGSPDQGLSIGVSTVSYTHTTQQAAARLQTLVTDGLSVWRVILMCLEDGSTELRLLSVKHSAFVLSPMSKRSGQFHLSSFEARRWGRRCAVGWGESKWLLLHRWAWLRNRDVCPISNKAICTMSIQRNTFNGKSCLSPMKDMRF